MIPVLFIGGAAFGYLYYKRHWRVLYLWPSGWQWKFGRARPRLRVYRGDRDAEPVAVPADTAQPLAGAELEAELDAVLAKVASQGKSSLTEREQQVLLRASEIYRQRRK